MGSGHNFEKFVKAILELSNSKVWLEAKPEWRLHAVYDDIERSCECGHQPIKQICVIKNCDNGNMAEVGNVCVHNFMQLASRRVFAVIKRVKAEITKSFNPDSLELFVRRVVIRASEMDDYMGYWRKRKYMTREQRAQKVDINRRILSFCEEEGARLIKAFRDAGLKPRPKGS